MNLSTSLRGLPSRVEMSIFKKIFNEGCHQEKSLWSPALNSRLLFIHHCEVNLNNFLQNSNLFRQMHFKRPQSTSHACMYVHMNNNISSFQWHNAPVMLEFWGMQSTPLLPSLPSPLLPGVVAPDRVLPMGQIELNCVLILNWIAWNSLNVKNSSVYLG